MALLHGLGPYPWLVFPGRSGLRYLDGLPVAEVAACLGRSVHATETLLVRARAALRQVCREEDSGDA